MTGGFMEPVPMIVTNIALIRVGWVMIGHVRTFINRRRRVRWRVSAIEVATMPEPLVLAVMCIEIGAFEGTEGASALIAAPALAASAAGLGVSLWAFISFPKVSTGHYVDSGQSIVRRGVYGWVRHPIYLGVFLIWIGFALGCQSAVAAAATVFYVIPVYLLYIRSEEEMMLEHFGEEYLRYCADVGGLLPRGRA